MVQCIGGQVYPVESMYLLLGYSGGSRVLQGRNHEFCEGMGDKLEITGGVALQSYTYKPF